MAAGIEVLACADVVSSRLGTGDVRALRAHRVARKIRGLVRSGMRVADRAVLAALADLVLVAAGDRP